MSSRRPGQRAGIGKADVLAQARAQLAEGGLETLTMRGLATRLGVAPNTLYSHVPSKTALIDELLDELLAEVRVPALDATDPVRGLHEVMASTYDVLLAHPDLVPLYLARQGARGPQAQRLGEVMLTLLGQAGVHGAAAGEALRVLIVYTIGFAAFATRPALAGEALGRATVSTGELSGTFTRGLVWLLAGIVA